MSTSADPNDQDSRKPESGEASKSSGASESPTPPKTRPLAEATAGPAEAEEDSDRRDFLQKAGSVLIGGAIVAAPTAVAVRVAISPLFAEKSSGVLARLTSLDALEPGAAPQAFKVIADKTDAWTTYRDLPLGLVYVQRTEDDELVVFSASCPHAGCAVEFRNTEKNGQHFYCPCHESSFNLDGSLAPSNTQAKRGLDTLEVDQEKLAAGEVWIRYRKFKAGIPEKKAIS